jgi:hypothetical protein
LDQDHGETTHRFVDLEPKDCRLYEANWAAVDADEAFAFFAESDGGGLGESRQSI